MGYKKHQLAIFVLIGLLLGGCSSKLERVRSHVNNDQWLKAVIEYRKLHRDFPDDAEIKSQLQRTEQKAAEYYYRLGYALLLDKEYDEAMAQFQQALIAKPGHEKTLQSIQELMRKKESLALYRDAVGYYDGGDLVQARQYANRSLELFPQHDAADKLLQHINEELQKDIDKNFILSSKNPITLRFKETKLKTAFEFIVNAYDVNVIFDEEVQNQPVNLFATNVTFEQALSLLHRTTKTFYKIVGDRTLLIAPDTDEKRAQYEDYILRTFTLRSIEAKVMADIIKSALAVNNVIINTDMNAIIVRETEERIKLIQDLVSINDRKPAEMILEVEILEVNRNKTELLGFDFGSQISLTYPPHPVGGAIKETLAAGIVTLPNIVLNYFKSDVDAKTLANPRIRVVDNKQAKIHLGDRVPLRSSTVQDATGQVRTTYEYRDIGIRLQFEPDIYLDNSVAVKLGLEVSTLGQNLGSVDDPALSIGTRNADTTMILKDGETAILGGLIRDEERKNRVLVPGLGDIPVLGALFTQYSDQITRTDVLLTITPHIVRTWDLADKQLHGIYSGTKKRYATTPVFGTLAEQGIGNANDTVATRSQLSPSFKPDIDPRLNVAFAKPVYIAEADDSIAVGMHVAGEKSLGQLELDLLFDPQTIRYASYELSSAVDGELSVEADNETGRLRITASALSSLDKASDTDAITLRFDTVNKGSSYLLSKAAHYVDTDGHEKPVESHVSRVVIK